jgi:hypothetical protein
VRTIGDRDPALVRFLSERGLRPGARLEVTEVVPYSGGVRIVIDGAEHIVGPDAAGEVEVVAA